MDELEGHSGDLGSDQGLWTLVVRFRGRDRIRILQPMELFV